MVLENELWALFRGKIFIPEIQPYPGPCLCVCITKPRGIGGLAFGERQCTSISALTRSCVQIWVDQQYPSLRQLRGSATATDNTLHTQKTFRNGKITASLLMDK